jgi:hypothetical protein
LAGYDAVVSLLVDALPAAATKSIPAFEAADIAEASVLEYEPPPHELLLTTMLWPAAFRAMP